MSTSENKNQFVPSIKEKLSCFYSSLKYIFLKEWTERQFYLFALCIAILISLVFYPGCFSNDSFSQLSQAESGSYGTWHPVIMALVMHYTVPILGVGSMLILHQFLYWIAFAIIIHCLFSNKLIYLLIGFFPPIFMLNLCVWKDVSMNSSFLLAIASILKMEEGGKFSMKWCVVCFISILYGCLVRLNGMASGFFLLGLLVVCIHRSKNLRIIQSVIIFCGTFFVILSSIYLLPRVLKAEDQHPLMGTSLWDISGVYYYSDGELKDFPEELNFLLKDTNTAMDLVNNYTPKSNSNLWTPDLNFKISDEQHSILTQTWILLIKKHPRYYLLHRIYFAKYLFQLPLFISYPCHRYGQNQSSNDIRLHINQLGLKVYSALYIPAMCYTHSYLGRSPFWLIFEVIILGVIGFKVLFRKRIITFKGIFVSLLCLSSLSTAFALFWIAPAADYRYLIYIITSGIIVLLTLSSKRDKLFK